MNRRIMILKKTFKHYLNFPLEVRMVIIDEMQPCDRVRFTRCSKMCNREAKASKKYIYSLDITAGWNSVRITVLHENFPTSSNELKGYCLEYKETNGSKHLIKTVLVRRRELWSKELDSSKDLVLLALEDFKQLLHLYHDRIKELWILGSANQNIWKTYDFEIESLNNLEILKSRSSNLFQFVSKLRRPLKCLLVRDAENLLASCDLIYENHHELKLHDLELNYEQMLRLTAQNIRMPIGILTETDILHFIQSWKNGTVGIRLESLSWLINRTDFEVSKVFRLFGKNIEGQREVEIEFKHSQETNKSAKLSYSVSFPPTLKFSVKIVEHP